MNSNKLILAGIFMLVLCQASLAQHDLTITTTSIVISKPAAYIFSFINDREVTPNAALAVVFPTGFDLTTVAVADSRTMDGGLQVRVQQDTVWVQRSGRGKTLVVGTRIDLILAAVISAEPTNQVNEFEILHKEKNEILSRSRQRVAIELQRAEKRQN
jgi:hypothetical protein